jgi:membrane protease YdiL (CAAX protease family)
MPSDSLKWIGIALALGGPVVMVAARHRFLGARLPAVQRAWTSIIMWLLVAAILLICVLGERRPLASLGFGDLGWLTWGWGAAIGAAGIALFPLYVLLSRALGLPLPDKDKLESLTRLPAAVRLLVLATAAGTEEILFRGYAITRLQETIGSPWLAGGISLVVFVLAHMQAWGLGHLIYVAAAGLVLTAPFVLEGDLWSNIIGHAIVDAVPLLLLPLAALRQPAAAKA